MTSSTFKSCCLLLIGKAGNGKSSTGNTVLDKECFDASNTGRSREPKINTGRFGDMSVTVVDGQGFESRKPNESNWTKRIITEIGSTVVLCGDGFDALIVVLKYGNRFTQEELDVIKILRQTLGSDIIKNHCILVYTHGEDFTLYSRRKEVLTFEEWCENQTGDLGDLIKECDSRVVLFHNLTEEMREESVQRLLFLVQKIRKRYTRAMFENLKEDHEKLVSRELASQAEQRLQKKIDQINQRLDNTKQSMKCPRDLKKELEILLEETTFVITEIEREDQGTDAFRFLKTSVGSVVLQIDSLLNSYHREENLLNSYDRYENQDSIVLPASNENSRKSKTCLCC